MSLRRFYAQTENFFIGPDGAGRVRLAPEEARHLSDVLRLRAGDEVFVFDGEGREFLCVVENVGRRGGNDAAVLLVQKEVEPPRAESRLELVLAVALLKGEKFDLVVQKATELGVVRIAPLMTRRAEVRLRAGDSDADKRVARWQRLAMEAAKQSGRARVPVVTGPISFSSLLKDELISDCGMRLMFAERGGRRLIDSISGLDHQALKIVALVGPEGGWDDEEIEEAARADWSIITLGGRTLRAETAAIVVTALLQHLCGDLA